MWVKSYGRISGTGISSELRALGRLLNGVAGNTHDGSVSSLALESREFRGLSKRSLASEKRIGVCG
jgi:hypothetical protein